ncbi:MAG TPA: hypothetical protein VH393_15105, partial [Ktedonobacterales bacterium]
IAPCLGDLRRPRSLFPEFIEAKWFQNSCESHADDEGWEVMDGLLYHMADDYVKERAQYCHN